MFWPSATQGGYLPQGQVGIRSFQGLLPHNFYLSTVLGTVFTHYLLILTMYSVC